MAITPLPTPPTRQDPVNFADRADAFLSQLPTFGNEANALALDVGNDRILAQTAAADAATSALNASGSAAAAGVTANAAAWVSGTSYNLYDNAIDPVDYFTYRRIVAGAGTTRPGLDNSNWVLLSSQGNVTTDTDQTISGLKTFTTSPVVPAGQTGNGPARANEVARLAAANTFTTRQVIADPANQGGMSTTSQTLGGLEIRANGAGMASIAFHRVGAHFAYFGLDTDAHLAIGGGSMGAVRRRIYHEGNILGTVSQSGGVPTGAIIEQGSNTNGRYVRYADGTQVCYAFRAPTSKPSSFRVSFSWTFPASFPGDGVAVFGNADLGSAFAAGWLLDYAYGCATEVNSSTIGTLHVASEQNMDTNWNTLRVHAMAIGRWF